MYTLSGPIRLSPRYAQRSSRALNLIELRHGHHDKPHFLLPTCQSTILYLAEQRLAQLQ